MGTLAQAIAQLEGFGVSSSNIPTSYNNPGDIKLPSSGGSITVFPDASSGWQALNNQIQMAVTGTSNIYSPSTTIGDFGTVYSGGNTAYGNNLASLLGVSPSTTLGELDQSQLYYTPSSASSASSSASSSGGTFWNPTNQPQQIDPSGKLGTLAGYKGYSSLASLVFSSRAITLVIGIILIAAGVFSFKESQNVISGTTRTLSRGARAAGLLALLLLSFLTPSFSQANTSPVVGTVTDGDGTAWSYATIELDLNSPAGPPVDITTRAPIQPSFLSQLDVTGSITVQVQRNDRISPPGSNYTIKICSLTSAPCQTSPTPITVTGTYNASTVINGFITAPRLNAGMNTLAYADIEINNPVNGSIYYNTFLPARRYYVNTNWTTPYATYNTGSNCWVFPVTSQSYQMCSNGTFSYSSNLNINVPSSNTINSNAGAFNFTPTNGNFTITSTQAGVYFNLTNNNGSGRTWSLGSLNTGNFCLYNVGGGKCLFSQDASGNSYFGNTTTLAPYEIDANGNPHLNGTAPVVDNSCTVSGSNATGKLTCPAGVYVSTVTFSNNPWSHWISCIIAAATAGTTTSPVIFYSTTTSNFNFSWPSGPTTASSIAVYTCGGN